MTKFHRYSAIRNRSERSRSSSKQPRVRAIDRTKLIRLMMVIGVLLAALIYLISVTTVSAQGFKITTLSQHIDELQRENQKMELNIAELQSGETIQDAANRMGLVQSQDVTYVQTDSAVALQD